MNRRSFMRAVAAVLPFGAALAANKAPTQAAGDVVQYTRKGKQKVGGRRVSCVATNLAS